MNDPNEQRGTDDRPEDGEGVATREMDDDGFGQFEQAPEPRAQERPDEPERDRDEATAVGSAGNGSADRAADRGDDEEEKEPDHGRASIS